jgi:hypothetical protein
VARGFHDYFRNHGFLDQGKKLKDAPAKISISRAIGLSL